MLKCYGCQGIDNINGQEDRKAINTWGTQGCVLVCFTT